jgi:hypothetical protein
LDQDVGPSVPIPDDVPADAIPEVDAKGCDDAQATGGMFDEDEEEEEEVPLTRKNNWHYRGSEGGSDTLSPALLALISLQELSISDFDQALEEVIPEDILSEPPEADTPVVCSEVPDGGPSLLDSAGQEVTRVVSRASSTLEGSLSCRNTDLSYPTRMEVAERPSALEVAAAEDLAPEGGAGRYLAPEGVAGSDPALVDSASCNPAPENVQACSLSNTSMDVHIGSSPIRSDGVTAARASTASTGQVALEVGEPDTRILLSASGTEVTPDSVLQVVPADLPLSSHVPAPPTLGLPLFLSNLQVSWSFVQYCLY